MDIDYPYTTVQLNYIKSKLDSAFLTAADKVYTHYGLGINFPEPYIYYKLWLYRRVINDHQQDMNGSVLEFYNSISEEQFILIVTDALNYCK